MSNNHKNSEMDILDRATAALRTPGSPETPGAEGPPPEVVASTFEAMQRELQLNPEPAPRLRNWRFIMIRTAKLSAAAVVLIGAIVGAVMLTNTNEAIAFAEVQKEIAKLRTVKFTVDLELPNQPGITGTVYLTAEGLMRQEQPMAVIIADTRKRTAMMLVAATKKAVISRDSDQSVDPLESLREVAKADARLVREEERDGKPTLVYHVGNTEIVGMRGDLTVWVNPETKLPVRIQAGHEEADEQDQTSVILRDFIWNQPLDPKLFSMDVPEGYDVVEETVAWSNAPGPAIAAGLEAYADLSGGRFPDAWDENTAERLEQKIRQETGTWPVAGGVEKMLTIDRASVAVQGLKDKGHDWHYAGANVKRGEKDKPIAWFKPDPKQDLYQVIFAHLGIREMTASELQKFVGKQ